MLSSVCEYARAPVLLVPLTALYFNPQHFLLLGLLFLGLFMYLLLVYLHKNEDSMMARIFPVSFTEFPVFRADSLWCRAAIGGMNEQSLSASGRWGMVMRSGHPQ